MILQFIVYIHIYIILIMDMACYILLRTFPFPKLWVFSLRNVCRNARPTPASSAASGVPRRRRRAKPWGVHSHGGTSSLDSPANIGIIWDYIGDHGDSPSIFEAFRKWGYPNNGWFSSWNIFFKWMIWGRWGYPHFWKPP